MICSILSSYDMFQPISYDGFRLFMKTYFDTDLPEQLCRDLFLSFVKTQTDNANTDLLTSQSK